MRPVKIFVSLYIGLLSFFVTAPVKGQDTLTLSGRVLDEAGKPLEGAVVALWNAQKRDPQVPDFKPDAQTKSDAEGKWTLEYPSNTAGFTVLSAGLRGLAIASKTLILKTGEPLKEPENLALQRVRPMSVKFVDWNNRPLPDVSVRLSHRNRPGEDMISGFFLPGIMDDALGTAKSDATGRATLPFGANGEQMTVKIADKSHESFEARISIPADDGLTLKLIPGLNIRGRIVDPAGKPQGGLNIGLLNAEDHTVTAPDGTFQLNGLNAAPASLALHEKDKVLRVNSFNGNRGETANIGDVVAVPGTVISGKVTESGTGKTFPQGGYVDATQLDPNPKAPNWRIYGAFAADGTYSLRLPDGDYSLGFRAYGNTPAYKKETVSIVGEKTINLNPVLVPNAPLDPVPVPQAPKPGEKKVEDADPPDYIYGKVLLPGGEPASGATVAVLQGSEVVREGKANAEGKFAIGPLVGDIGVNGKATGLIKTAPGAPAPKIYVRATLPNFSSKTINVNPAKDEPITLQMLGLADLRLRIVTSDGKPLSGATVVPKSLKVYTAEENRPWQNAAAGTIPSFPGPIQSDARGEVVFKNMPTEGLCRIAVSHPGFADFTHVVALPRKDQPDLIAMRPAVVEGRILLGDETLIATKFDVKIQSFGAANLWLTVPTDPKGRFEFANIVPSSQLNEDRLVINLNLTKDKGELAPGLTAEYVQAGRNWNVILNDTRNGALRRWICYVDKLPLLEEGEQITYEFKAVPLVKVSGKLLPANATTPLPGNFAVTYEDPAEHRAMYYEPMSATIDKDGNFETWVPAATSITLDVRPKNERWSSEGTRKTLDPIPAGETKTVEIKLGDSNVPSGPLSSYVFRILGPDNVTVPRALVKYTLPGEAEVQMLSALDGTIWVFSQSPLDQSEIRFTSPYLDAPIKIKADKNTLPVIKLNRVPTELPTGSSVNWGEPNPGQAKPSMLAVGEQVTDFRVEKWIYGEPVRPADLKDKITVCLSDATQVPALLPVINRYPGKIAVVIFYRTGGMNTLAETALTNGLPNSDDLKAQVKAAVTAIAEEVTIQNEWRGYNIYRLQAGSGASIIDSEARLAAVSLRGNDLAAKVDQLAANLVTVKK